MSDYKKQLEEQLKNPDFAAEWERQASERECIKEIIAAKTGLNLTQEESSKMTEIGNQI